MLQAALVFIGAAHATSMVTDIGPVLELKSSGTWARALSIDGEWRLAYATNGDFFVAPLSRGTSSEEWSLDTSSRLQLTNHGDLNDHAIKRCPDGSWLHVASGQKDNWGDSAYAYRYASDFTPTAEAVIAEGDSSRMYNDMALLCANSGQGVAFATEDYMSGDFFVLDNQAAVSDSFEPNK